MLLHEYKNVVVMGDFSLHMNESVNILYWISIVKSNIKKRKEKKNETKRNKIEWNNRRKKNY